MKLSYQISTPEVQPLPSVTAYQAPLEVSFARLRECGYDGAELMVRDPARVDAAAIRALSGEYGLPVCMVCTGEVFGQDGLSFTDPDDGRRNEAIARAKAAADLAAAVGAPQINIGRIRGWLPFSGPVEQARTRSVEAMREVAQYAGTRNVLMALEPVNTLAINFINTTQEGVAMVEEIAQRACKLMLDSNHMFLCDKDLTKSINDARDCLSFVHLVDSNRLYPGSCKLDFAAFLGDLRAIGYDGWLSVEVFQRPDQDAALERSAAYLKELLK